MRRRSQFGALPLRAVWAWRCVLGLVVLQVTLGITTLLLQVPVFLASLHQMGAFLLLGSLLVGQEVLRKGLGPLRQPA